MKTSIKPGILVTGFFVLVAMMSVKPAIAGNESEVTFAKDLSLIHI